MWTASKYVRCMKLANTHADELLIVYYRPIRFSNTLTICSLTVPMTKVLLVKIFNIYYKTGSYCNNIKNRGKCCKYKFFKHKKTWKTWYSWPKNSNFWRQEFNSADLQEYGNSVFSCERDTARICCWAPCCDTAAAVHRYLLPARRSAANSPHAAAAVEWGDRQTDRWTRQTLERFTDTLFRILCEQ